MPTVRLRADILRADRTAADRWYVTNGATAVGPVALELVERGVEAGRIPVESYIRHELWKIWRPLSELCVTTETKPIDPLGTPLAGISLPPATDSGPFDPRETTMKPAMTAPRPSPLSFPAMPFEPVVTFEPPEMTAPVSKTLPAILAAPAEEIESISIEPEDEGDPSPDGMLEGSLDLPRAVLPPPRMPPPPPPSVEDITLPGRPPKITEVVTGDPLSGAALLKDALLTLSGVILRDVGCEGVMIHRVDDEGAVVVVAHGPRMFDLIGMRTRLLDPAIVAAAAGILVVAEPTPGPAGQSILGRLERLGVTGAGAVMIPIRPHGRLFGTVEMGQSNAFDGVAIATAEGFVRIVQAKMEAADWRME